MDKERFIKLLINILKKTFKWLLILLAIIFVILVIIAVYLLVAEYFYDGETLGLEKKVTAQFFIGDYFHPKS